MRTRGHARARARRLGTALAAALLVVAFLGAAPAQAAPTCTFDEPSATVTVSVGNAEIATIVRSGDAITLDGTPCGSATVNNTEAVAVTTTGIPAEIGIDLSGGPFAPGKTPETDGGESEIEFTIHVSAGSPTVRIVGSAATDTIVAGAAGLNLNAGEDVGDPDVLIVGLPSVVIAGQAGNDSLSVAGGGGTGAASTARLDGGAGNDGLIAALGGNAFDGGEDEDTVNYGGAQQLVSANLSTGVVEHAGGATDQVTNVEDLLGSPGDDTIVGSDAANVLRAADGADVVSGGGGNDDLDGGAGLDTVTFAAAQGAIKASLADKDATGEGNDVLVNIENLTGSPQPDRLEGDAAANTIDGGAGDDRIDGAAGDDVLDGGAGKDTAEYTSATAAVKVDLGKGTGSGNGTDTLTNFEGATGGPKADTLNGDGSKNLLDGADGADTVNGRNGSDHVEGGPGRDRLFGQKGNDGVYGGPGNDQLDGGKGKDDFCDGGPDPDSFVLCETIKTG